MASLVSSGGFRPPGGSGSGGPGLNPTAAMSTGVVTTPAASAMASGSGPGSGIGGQSILGTTSASGSSFKPVPMKLFATWEVDRTPPNCIPR